MSMLDIFESIKKFYKHITNYNTYKLRYNATEMVPQRAKYHAYPVGTLGMI